MHPPAVDSHGINRNHIDGIHRCTDPLHCPGCGREMCEWCWGVGYTMCGCCETTSDASPQAWKRNGACVGASVDLWFSEGNLAVEEAKAICARCAVRPECLAYAMATHQDYGVWGGLSEAQRRTLRRRRGRRG